MQSEKIDPAGFNLDDQQASISIVRARVIRWKHEGNACDCENKIIQLEGSHPRRSPWYLEAKCGRCHLVVRLFIKKGKERWTIDPQEF